MSFEPSPEELAKPLKTKVYVYVQLKGVINIPKRDGEIEAKLQFGEEEIPRLDKECTPCQLMKRDQMGCSVTFSFPVYQDSIECLNKISDNPVLIILYERVIHPPDDEMTECYEEQIPIAQGYIDLLGYFKKKRFSEIVETFIFPIDKIGQIETGTCRMSWQVYTLLPLLKNLDYSNLIFISFESIYNCTEDLLDSPEDLRADIVLRDERTHEMIEICSFSGFIKKVINQQNPSYIWESARSVEQITGSSFGFHTDSKLNIFRIFKRILHPKEIRLNFGSINATMDEALVCNSTHRFVLTEELRSLLEDIFIFRTHGLVVRLYRTNMPEDILLEGGLDPSVFLYPFVNAVRLAVAFRPSIPSPKITPRQSKKRKSRKDTIIIGDTKPLPEVFGIISVCLLTPLTESVQNVAKYAQLVPKGKLNRCISKRSDATTAPIPYLKEMAYNSFDDWLAEVIDYIIRKNILEVSEAKNFFCCQSQNAENKILALIALDFNQRTKTKDNIEFCNLLTTAYKELEERAYKYIEACGTENIKDCQCIDKGPSNHLIILMEYMKFANEVGDKSLSKVIMEELTETYTKKVDFNFYKFLNDVENGCFEEAKAYIAKPIKDRKLKDEYFVRILSVYIQYIENLSQEDVYNEAFEHLLCNLNEFLKNYRADSAGWILLYCLYNSSEYLPGTEFARWHFEDLDISVQKTLEDAPYSRWDIYFKYDIEFSSQKGAEFYKIAKMFQSIGAYKFAEIVFNEINKECNEVERYMQEITFKILLRELDSNTSRREFAEIPSGLGAILNQINGNLSYACGRKDEAMDYYENVFQVVTDSDDIEIYKLGLRRYANQMMSRERFGRALKVLKVLNMENNSMSVLITMGRVYYKLGHFREALECFKQSTEFNLFIPDTWGYLALIHLKLGENFYALECWKYAKHNPNTVISKEIINELNKICVDDVDLYVDRLF